MNSFSSSKINPVLLLIVPGITSILVFCIFPAVMYIPAAFLDWRPPQQISDASFVGLKWFRDIIGYYKLPQLIRNSVILGLWDILLLPVPMFLALAIHHCGSSRLKKTVEIFSLVPVFIPSVIVAAVTQRILSTEGLLNEFLAFFGIVGQNWLLNGELFYAYFSLSALWSSLGFPCLVYRSCLSSSSYELHAVAQLDGASLFTRMIRIDLPLCRSTFLINLTMSIAGILNTSTERLLLFSNTAAIVLHNGYIHCVDEGHRFFTGQVLAEMFSWKDIISVSIGGELHDDYFCIGLKKDGTVLAIGNNEFGQCNIPYEHYCNSRR